MLDIFLELVTKVWLSFGINMKLIVLIFAVSLAVLGTASPIDNACICLDYYSPVCGQDGNIYSNECALKCAGVPPADGSVTCGMKMQKCICPDYYRPICGQDGNVYDNECALNCAGVPPSDGTVHCGWM
ncbi:uncharacterized protein LOC142982654 [Anticarsia gemmatalis]|uniref:uncharacterized protein LOC142982654 n=1 Tax=Anticarsia gemmatalis TaxID=129554 RepID=UPI003F7616BF